MTPPPDFLGEGTCDPPEFLGRAHVTPPPPPPKKTSVTPPPLLPNVPDSARCTYDLANHTKTYTRMYAVSVRPCTTLLGAAAPCAQGKEFDYSARYSNSLD